MGDSFVSVQKLERLGTSHIASRLREKITEITNWSRAVSPPYSGRSGVFTNSFLSRWWSIATHMNETWHLHEGVVLYIWMHWRRLGICFEFHWGCTWTFCGWKSTFEICLYYTIVLRLTCDFGIASRRETPTHARPHCVRVFHDRTSHVFEKRCIHIFKRLSCCNLRQYTCRSESWAGVVRCV